MLSPTYGLLWLLGLWLFMAGCNHTEPDPNQGLSTSQLAVVRALNQVALPIQDADPTRSFTDLAPLDSVLANAQLIGLGEGSHGTHEFFQMKDRLFRYIVQRHGGRALGFEASFGLCVTVNRFIHGESTAFGWATDAARSLRLLPWQVTEVSDLLQWMKDYNKGKTADQQLSFYGFDCQSADDNFPLIRDFLTTVDPASVGQLDSLASLYSLSGGSSSRAAWGQYSQRLPPLYNLFVSHETQWMAAGGQRAYQLARHAVRVLIQNQDVISSNQATCLSYSKRDQYMAENIQWLSQTLGSTKLGLWAHSGHVANLASVCGSASMGYLLKQQLGNKYLIVGTSFSSGTFTAIDESQANRPLSSLSIQAESIKSTSNYLLGKVQYPNFMLNLTQSPADSSLRSWLQTAQPFLLIAANYDNRNLQQVLYTYPLRGSFDVLIHFRDTTPTHIL
ncbi:erythromycin esterase family protein [Spirosoma koreense]